MCIFLGKCTLAKTEAAGRAERLRRPRARRQKRGSGAVRLSHSARGKKRPIVRKPPPSSQAEGALGARWGAQRRR